MFQQLLFNVTIIISFLFVLNVVRERVKEKNVKVNKWMRIFSLGAAFGMLGIILMIYTIPVDEHTIIDLRHLATVVVAVYAGFWASILSAVMIAVGRIALFGIHPAALVASSFMVLIGITCGLISKRNVDISTKFHTMNVMSLLLIFVALLINIGDLQKVLRIYSYHTIVSVSGGFLVFMVGKYLYQSTITIQRHRSLSQMFSVLIRNAHTGTMIETADRQVAVINQTFCDIFELDAIPKQMIGKKSDQMYEEKQHVVKHSMRFIKRLDDIIAKKKVIEGEEFTFANGRVYALDYVPIYEGNEYIGHYWEYRNITKRKEAEEKLLKLNQELQQLSNRDGLTKLSNRRALDKRIKMEWDYAIKQQHSLSFILFDLDYFKAYNDTYGHLTGDDCLEKVGAAMQDVMDPSLCVARYGGEEFAVVLPVMDEEETMKIAETIRMSIYNLSIPHEASPISDYVTVSVGVATMMPTEQDSMTSLIEAADQALYDAKGAGRNTVRVARGKWYVS